MNITPKRLTPQCVGECLGVRLLNKFIFYKFRQFRGFHPFLFPRIAVANGDGVVFRSVEINGNAEGRADFVLPAIALADVAVVVKYYIGNFLFKISVDFAGFFN